MIQVSELGLFQAGICGEDARRSVSQLRRKIAAISSKSVSVKLVMYSGKLLEYERDLFDSLSVEFSQRVESLIITSFDPPKISAVIKFKSTEVGEVDEPNLKDVERFVRSELQRAGMSLGSLECKRVEWPAPHKVTILSVVKVRQPVMLAEIERDLVVQHYGVESTRWLNHQLDMLRKDGLVVRSNHDGRYRLTQQGNAILIGSKHRGSTDVRRALALGRRRW